jgi:hypothetical protein
MNEMDTHDMKTPDPAGGSRAMRIFGPNTQLVLAFLAGLSDLSREDLARVANAWRQTDSRDRAEAWAQLHRTASDRERHEILAAATVARWEALDAAVRRRWHDWSFWAAASDAAAAIAARDRIGRDYQTLISPLSAVMPWLPPAAGEARSGKDVAAGYLPSADALEQGA